VGFPLFHCGWWLLIFCWIWNIHFPLIRVEISKFFSGCLKSQVLRNCQYLWNVADFCHIKFCLWTHLSAIMWKEHAKYSFIAYFGLTKKKWFSPMCLFWAFEFWLWFWIGSLLHMVIRNLTVYQSIHVWSFWSFLLLFLQDVQLKVPVLYFEDFARIKDALAVEGAHKTHSCFWATLCCPIVNGLDSWYFCYIEREKCDSLYTMHKCTWWSWNLPSKDLDVTSSGGILDI
jgi:hypothetical protein